MTFPDINLTNYVQDIYAENYNTDERNTKDKEMQRCTLTVD